jgi:hypothetical protein
METFGYLFCTIMGGLVGWFGRGIYDEKKAKKAGAFKDVGGW